MIKHGGRTVGKQSRTDRPSRWQKTHVLVFEDGVNASVVKRKYEDSLVELRLLRCLRRERDFFLLWGGVVDPRRERWTEGGKEAWASQEAMN